MFDILFLKLNWILFIRYRLCFSKLLECDLMLVDRFVEGKKLLRK